MMKLRSRGLVLCAALFHVALAAAMLADPRPFSAKDLVAMSRVSGPQASLDGQWVVFTLRETDMAANRGRTDLWLVKADGAEAPRRLTTHEGSDSSALWAPDGKSLYFLSSRSGSSQVWRLSLSGGEAEQVTELDMDVANLVLAPNGRHLAFTLEVFPDCADLPCTVQRKKEVEDDPATGQVYDRLFVRHWDTWKDGRRSHLFSLPLNGAGRVPDGAEPARLSAGFDGDIPAKPFGGREDIVFTPDSRGVVFAARVAGSNEPWSTNFDLYLSPVDGSAAPRKLTDNPAWDTHPVFSPDGKTMAYLAMRRPGYESDRLRLMLRSWPDGETRELAGDWDRSVAELLWSRDGKSLLVTASDHGERPLFRIDAQSGAVEELFRGGIVRSPNLGPGDAVIFGRDHFESPVDLYRLEAGSSEPQRITEINRERLAEVALGEPEHFSFAGWNGEKVWGWVVKPPGLAAGEKVPVAFLIHGGPQGSFSNSFHYRWNPQPYIGAGYAAVMIDFHGSTGYGQAFTDSIRDDWGGKPLEDLQKGLKAALSQFDYLDGEQVCALGASYGGYMINWIAGNWPDRFRCLVNHDGVFDHRSMYYSTEELWFPEWEFRGTPWTRPEGFERHNPALFVDRWKTPMLVIHGALDYRVVDTQGLAAFTALQRRGIPSQLLFFPDENHWVLKPANSLQWHHTVLAWMDRWLGEEASQ